MPDITSIEIPKPLHWQDFQKACVPLFRRVIGDPHLQEYGREGQAQGGIDLLGCRDGNPAKPVGVQCRRIEDPITEAALRKEAAKAKSFQPTLTELIFATTSDRDAKIQATAAKLTQELHDEGWECRIIVMGWHDLRLEIAKNADALDAFMPSGRVLQQPMIDAVRNDGSATRAKIDESAAVILEKIESLAKSQGVLREDYDADLSPEAEAEPRGLHAKISAYAAFIKKGQTKIAFSELEKLREQQPPLPPYARYRVLANMAAVHFSAGRFDDALEVARQALALRPSDPKARTNLAFAELVTGDREGAARRAEGILADHPDHGPAASALIQARATDMSVSDPFALVPAGTHNTADFKIAATVFLRQRDDVSWRELALAAAAAHADSVVLQRFAAEAELEPVLADPELMLGKPTAEGTFDNVRRSADILRKIWTDEIAAEEVGGDELVPLASNLASALRCIGDDKSAGDVLDATIAKVGNDPVLLRARALLHMHADENEKAVALLTRQGNDAEVCLFTAQLLAAREPDRAATKLAGLDIALLPENLKPVVPEVRAEIALAKNDAGLFQAALDELDAINAPVAIGATLMARGAERGLVKDEAGKPDKGQVGAEDDDDIEDMSDADERLPAHIVKLIRQTRDHEAKLSLADRILTAQYLDSHNAFEVASSLLHDRVAFDRDTVGLRTYLSASVGAHLTARAQKVLDNLPEAISAKPFYQRVAATHYWNTGDVKSAAPLIESICNTSPRRLDFLLWRIDALLRMGQEKKIRELLAAPVENNTEGTVPQKVRLVAALSSFGQPERALRLAYRQFMLNRNTAAAWMGFMSVMLTAGKSDDMNLLSEVIGDDHSFEVKFDDGSVRRYLIESDETVRNVEPDALSPDHPIAVAVQDKKPDDRLVWPTGSGEATITAVKHKYLDAFHSAMARFNERFPTAKGFRQVTFKTEGEGAFAELKAELIARSEYVTAQTKQYADGKLSLSMLAFMTGADPIDVIIGLSELGNPYRVAVGIEFERSAAFKAISDNGGAGCIVDVATFYCIRRLEIEDVITGICGKIGVTQATADICQMRLQNLNALDDSKSGSMGYRDGKYYLTERSEEECEKTRTIIVSDIEWLRDNADVVPARPVEDPPSVFRRLGTVKGARFFDDVYAANGSQRILLVDDLFTRQVAGQLGTPATSLQPVLMFARNKDLMSLDQYAKAITDLIEFGQSFISIDTATLAAARKLDRENGEPGLGRRFKAATQALGGRNAEPASHCRVVVGFLKTIWSSDRPSLDDFAVTSHVLSELVKGRTEDYKAILGHLDQKLGLSWDFRIFLREWATGHFLAWP